MDESMENQEPFGTESDAMGEEHEAGQELIEAVTGYEVSHRDLADHDFDTALKVGALPIALFALLLLVAAFFYVARKKSAWSDEDLGNLPAGPDSGHD